MNTKIRGPWPGKEPKSRTSIAVEDLKIASDPYVDHRSRPTGKYDTLFAKLKPGQCIVCQPGKAAIVKTALDKWLKATGKEGVARARSRYPSDNMGRVWSLVE